MMIDEDRNIQECCGVCGYRFKPGDIVHELEIGRENETVCEMCYHIVLRRG